MVADGFWPKGPSVSAPLERLGVRFLFSPALQNLQNGLFVSKKKKITVNTWHYLLFVHFILFLFP